MPVTNDLAVVVDKLLASGLLALRSACVMPALVNHDYETMAAEKGQVITIPIPSAIAAQDVTPSETPPAGAASAPTSASIQLNQWKEARFTLTDKEIQEIMMTSFMPMQTSEAIKSLAETVNAYILGLYKGVYGYVGTAGTTPFASDTIAATSARKTLNNQLAPLEPRAFVLDGDAEANALNLRAFQDASWANSADVIYNGQINRKLGFAFLMDQQIPKHTAGSLTGSIVVSGAHTKGDATILLASGSAEAIDLKNGDIITFSTHTQTYVVTEDLTVGASATGTVKIAPVLQVDVADAVEIAVKATHVVNLAFHRDAFAFASRPLADVPTGGSVISSTTDPQSGLSLRLEVSRQHRQTSWAFDILYGASLIRRELATRVAG